MPPRGFVAKGRHARWPALSELHGGALSGRPRGLPSVDGTSHRHLDDERHGYLDASEVVARWPALVADLQHIVLPPEELAYLTAAAQEETEADTP